MPTPHNNNRYQTFHIAESETVEACFYSPAQRARLQNDLVGAIEQKLSLAPSDMTAASKESYWQQEAYLRGQIDYINTLLVGSDDVAVLAMQSTDPGSTSVASNNSSI